MGIPDPELFRGVLPAATWERWQAFAEVEPFGALAEELRAGKVAAAIYNAAPFRAKGSSAISPTEFVPRSLLPPRPPPDWRQMKAALKASVIKSGGQVVVLPKEPKRDG